MEPGTSGSELQIVHDEKGGHGRFYVPGTEGRLAELTYARSSPESVIIEETWVSDALAGQGVGKRLVEEAVAWARLTGTSFVLVCPFARSVFDRYPELREVLE
jgi:hypothetical protein